MCLKCSENQSQNCFDFLYKFIEQYDNSELDKIFLLKFRKILKFLMYM